MAIQQARKSNTLQELAASLAKQAEEAEDYVADTRRMGFYVGAPGAEDAVTLDGEEHANVALTIDGVDDEMFSVNEHAQQQMAARLDIPRRHWERLRDNYPGLLTNEVTTIMNREPEVRMVRTIGNTARAYLSDRYRRIDNYDYVQHAIAPALQELGQERVVVLAAQLTDLKMYVKVLFPDVTFPDPRPQGGEIHGGAIFGNSEVGSGSFFIDPFTYQSYCLNGLVYGKQSFSDFGLRKTHLGAKIEDTQAARQMFSEATMRKEDEALFAQAHDVIVGCVNGIRFEAIRAAIENAAGIKVDGDVPKTVEKLGKSSGLRETETAHLMQHLIEGGDLSAYGFVNALTRTAQDVESYDRQVELERIGGDMLDWSERAWREIAVPVAVA